VKIGTRSRHAFHGAVSLDMTSMIDATFLLLSFFLFTTSIGGKESHLLAEVARTRAGQRASALSPQAVEVTSDATGALFRIGTHAVRTRDELAAVLRALPHDIGIVVRVHDGPTVGAVAAAMQAARDAGFSKVSYVAHGG